MEYTYNVINLNKYEKYDELRKGIFEYRAKSPENTLSRENHNIFFAKRALWSPDLHISEHLGGLIGKKCGFKICDTELYRHPIYPADKGIISFVSLSENDKLITPKRIIQEYLKYQNLEYKDLVYTDIDTVFKAIFWFMYQYKRPYEEFSAFKQDFIDMVVFDLELLNPDRSLENWFIRQDTQTKTIDLYPMFDNEMILGFDRQITEFEFSSDQLKYEISKTTSAILTPEAHFKHKRNADYNELFKYLLKKYPIQTQNSLRKFSNFSLSDLSNILNKLPDLSEYRKDIVVDLFNTRNQSLNKIYDEYLIQKSEESIRKL